MNQKFPVDRENVVSTFLFNKWILKQLCVEGNKNGLILDNFIASSLKNNFKQFRKVFSYLVASENKFSNKIVYETFILV